MASGIDLAKRLAEREAAQALSPHALTHAQVAAEEAWRVLCNAEDEREIALGGQGRTRPGKPIHEAEGEKELAAIAAALKAWHEYVAAHPAAADEAASAS